MCIASLSSHSYSAEGLRAIGQGSIISSLHCTSFVHVLQEVNAQHADLRHTAMHASSKHSLTQQHQDSGQEFKYTLGAARLTELRRLKSFVKMADYMMCDTLQQVCNQILHMGLLCTALPCSCCSSIQVQANQSAEKHVERLPFRTCRYATCCVTLSVGCKASLAPTLCQLHTTLHWNVCGLTNTAVVLLNMTDSHITTDTGTVSLSHGHTLCCTTSSTCQR